jgi:hypothetical protein
MEMLLVLDARMVCTDVSCGRSVGWLVGVAAGGQAEGASGGSEWVACAIVHLLLLLLLAVGASSAVTLPAS